MALSERLSMWGRLIVFPHSVFALPFALIMIVLVASERSVTLTQVALLVVCVVSARASAMAFNRYVDAEIDAQNPRTMNREIPTGVVSKRGALLLVLASSGIFIAGAAGLGRHCLVLSPLVLFVLLGYSFMKRFSSWCHVVLGVALALAPGGVWYALTGEWSWKPVPLMLTVTLWVAGFDILYSCQDAEFDRSQKLFSVPSVLGVARAKLLALSLHIGSLGFLVVNGYLFNVGAVYWLGALIFAGLLISQHRAVMVHGIECIDRVFFTRNGAASILLFVFVLVDTATRG